MYNTLKFHCTCTVTNYVLANTMGPIVLLEIKNGIWISAILKQLCYLCVIGTSVLRTKVIRSQFTRCC
jgi:hypothetical protein